MSSKREVKASVAAKKNKVDGENEKSINDLTDDCLRVLFSKMSSTTLTNLAYTSTRFMNLIRNELAHIYKMPETKKKYIDLNKFKKCEIQYNHHILDGSNPTYKKIIHFGDFIEEIFFHANHLSLRDHSSTQPFIKFINDHCVNMSSFHLYGSNLELIVLLLGRIKHLSATRCIIPRNIMEFGHNLESICFSNCTIPRNVANLESICFSGDANEETLVKILRQNPIKKIDLQNCKYINAGVLQTIANYAPKLESLTIKFEKSDDCDYPDIEEYGFLEHLKHVHIEYERNILYTTIECNLIRKFLDHIATSVHLNTFYLQIRMECNGVLNLKNMNLQKLWLPVDYYTNDQIVDIAENSTHLHLISNNDIATRRIECLLENVIANSHNLKEFKYEIKTSDSSEY